MIAAVVWSGTRSTVVWRNRCGTESMYRIKSLAESKIRDKTKIIELSGVFFFEKKHHINVITTHSSQKY